MDQRRVWMPRLGLAAVAVAAVLVAVALSTMTEAQYGPGLPVPPGDPDQPNIPDRPGNPIEPLTITLTAPDVCEVHRPQQSIHTVIHAEDDAGNRPAPTITRYWAWDAGGSMEVSWEVSGGEPPYYLLINGEAYDVSEGKTELSCAMSHGTYQTHPTYGLTLAEAPLVDSGVLEITGEVSDQSQTGGRAKDTAKSYALLTPDHDHVLSGGETYRIAGRLTTIPEGMTMRLGDWVHGAEEGLKLRVVGSGAAGQEPWLLLRIGPYPSDPIAQNFRWREYEITRQTGTSAAALDRRFDQLLQSVGQTTAIARALGQPRISGHESGAPGLHADDIGPVNGNLIAGQTTVICTNEAEFKAPLTEAVAAWNTRLSGLLVGAQVFTLRTDARGAGCVDRSGSDGDVHVRVLRGTNCDKANAAACYQKWGTPDSRRVRFRTDYSLHHARITYQSEVVRFETLMHELGHVLGLADYDSCDDLRNPAAPETDIDHNNDDLSLMAKRDSICRSGGVVTGRSLRDLFEVYYPAPLEQVSTAYDAAAQKVRFTWLRPQELELAHQADLVGLFQPGANGGWTLVDETVTQVSGTRNQVELPLADGQEERYLLAGLTQVQLNTLLGWGHLLSTVTINNQQYSLGESLIASRVVTAGATPQQAPVRLAASVSPTSCYVTGANSTQELPVNVWTYPAVAPESPNSANLVMKIGTTTVQSETVPCSLVSASDNLTSLVVTATHPDSSTPAEVTLPIHNREYDRPNSLDTQHATFDFNVLSLPSPRECEVGQDISAGWVVTPPAAVVHGAIWVQDKKVTGTSGSVACPHPTSPSLVGFVLLPDGSGSRDTVGLSKVNIPDLDASKNNVTATAESSRSIKLSWASATNNSESGFYLTCRESATSGTGGRCPLGPAPPPAQPVAEKQLVRTPPTAFTFIGLKPDTEYEFGLQAWYGHDSYVSTWLNGITARTQPDPLELSANFTSGSPISCEVGESVEVEWAVTGGRQPVNVTVDGKAVTTSPASVVCKEASGQAGQASASAASWNQTITVQARDSRTPPVVVTKYLQVTVTPSPPTTPPGDGPPTPPSLTASITESPASCEAAEALTLEWAVQNGGGASYTITASSTAPDGTETSLGELSGTSTSVACAEPVGTWTVTVTATDSSATPTVSFSATASYEVLAPEITVTGRVNARRNDTAAGEIEVEFAFTPKDAARILPQPKAARTLKPQAIIDAGKLNDWYRSSSVIMTIDGEAVDIGQVRTRLRQASDGRYYFEICFRWSDGMAQCPDGRNFYYAEKQNLQWAQSQEFSRTFRPGAAASAPSALGSSSDDMRMDGTGAVLDSTWWDAAGSSDDSQMEDVEDN